MKITQSSNIRSLGVAVFLLNSVVKIEGSLPPSSRLALYLFEASSQVGMWHKVGF